MDPLGVMTENILYALKHVRNDHMTLLEQPLPTSHHITYPVCGLGGASLRYIAVTIYAISPI